MSLAPVAAGGIAAQSMDAARHERLKTAAHQFEASLLTEILKPLQRTGAAVGGEEEDSAEGPLQDLAAESLARALSDRGGFGIADRVLHQFEAAGPAHQPETTGGGWPAWRR
jgi:Rod binding domain-containing protein